MSPIIIAICLLLAIIIFLIWKYSEIKEIAEQRNRELLELKGMVEQRAREIFEEWRDRELEDAASRKAEILFEKWKQEYEDKIRKDAIEKSKSVIIGKVTEHLIPYLPEFKYNPKDARFIGSPIDLIVFDGLDEGELRKIVFIEVKSSKSTLSKRERLIRDIIKEKKVEWEVLRHST